MFTVIIIVILLFVFILFVFFQYRKTVREAKNYERGLKMVPMYIHIPPSGEDLESNGRDERELTQEVLSQAQVMYNIISSTATKGFKSKVYGQKHISFEIIAHEGLVHYYAIVPAVIVDIIKQAISAAYPAVRLEEVEEKNIFNKAGKITGTVGGEFTLKKSYVYPIATFQESKRDASRALLNALSTVGHDDGVAIQLMVRPAFDSWSKNSIFNANKIKKDKGKNKNSISNLFNPKGLIGALWEPPEDKESKPEDKQLSSLEQGLVDAIEEKTRYPGYETLIRVVVSSDNSIKAKNLLKNIIAAFSLFDSTVNNGFKFSASKDIEELVTSYIFRFFPQTVNKNILNSVELATIFHLPNQNSIPTSQIQRQMTKQVDGPVETMDEGFLLGVNEFRGVKKEIRLSTNDRRRHTYFIGQTGTGKSVLLENLAYQDMMDGRGFAFIDPHGDSAEKLLGVVPKERVEDIIYFNPSDMENPIGLNLFEFETQDQRDFLIQEAIAMLYRLYDPGHTGIIGPRYEHWFRNASLTIMSDPNGSTFIDIPQVFNDQAFTDEKMKYITDRTVLDFWNKEMAQTSEANKSEVLGWFVSKFGAFLSNEMMRNVIGQTKSGFNLREIMDKKKILIVNLSKGTTGELNSQLLGMIFVMKFQAAAMGRANIPEDQREDFSLYVDEFQNFATDSFATILSEARKYKLNLILANQFMTQLTDNIREAILGNIGTVISGRLGITDAEMLQKKFMPTFDAEDLTKLPNYKTITSVMINGVPSAAFSMSLIPPMVKNNSQLGDAIKRLSSAKYGKPRAQVEKEIFARLGAGDAAKKEKMEAMKKAQEERMGRMSDQPKNMPQAGQALGNVLESNGSDTKSSSFLDNWLAKRQQSAPKEASAAPKVNAMPIAEPVIPTAQLPQIKEIIDQSIAEPVIPTAQLPEIKETLDQPAQNQPAKNDHQDGLHLKGGVQDDEITIKLRD